MSARPQVGTGRCGPMRYQARFGSRISAPKRLLVSVHAVRGSARAEHRGAVVVRVADGDAGRVVGIDVGYRLREPIVRELIGTVLHGGDALLRRRRAEPSEPR